VTPRLDILPPAQRRLWPGLSELPDDFVLYGGTAVALRLGHRTSVDFDFFSDRTLPEPRKRVLLEGVPCLAAATVIQTERDTLTVVLGNAPDDVKLSFFGNIGTGCVSAPSLTDDRVMTVASADDLLGHKLKAIHDRAEGKDYEDIAAMLGAGQSLARGLACRLALFGASVPTMTTLKALMYLDDINEAWRVPPPTRRALAAAVERVPPTIAAATIHSLSLAGAPKRNR
jgi:hypothetical protein